MPVKTHASGLPPVSQETYGVLVDTTLCVGCRKCEWACNQAGDFDHLPMDAFDPSAIPDALTLHSPDRFTMINRFFPDGPELPVFIKSQCMHCLDPACYSACLVNAFGPGPKGAIVYDAQRCMGCRYCMVACPFDVPAFEFSEAVAPRIRKCDFCASRLKQNLQPACVEICPVQCMTFGLRPDLLKQAHERIRKYPDRYIDHIYGEKEAGGTRWLYLASHPFEKLGLPGLSEKAPPRLVEGIQHCIFKHTLAPVLLGLFLAGVRWNSKHGSSKTE